MQIEPVRSYRFRNDDAVNITLTHGNIDEKTPIQWTIMKTFKEIKAFHDEITNHFKTDPRIIQAFKRAKSSLMEGGSDPKEKQRFTKAITKRPQKSITVKFVNPHFFDVNCSQHLKTLKTYFSFVFNSKELRKTDFTAKFLQVSRLSFVKDFGGKNYEGFVRKSRGGYINDAKSVSRMLDFTNGPLAKLFGRKLTHKNIVVLESCVCYLDKKTHELRGVLNFDTKFIAELGKYSRHVIISNEYRTLKVVTENQDTALKLLNSINSVIDEDHGKELVKRHPGKSFAPVRENTPARWFICGKTYFYYLFYVLQQARSEIFITDWMFTPYLKLIREGTDFQKQYLSDILMKKSEEGVRVYVLLFDPFTAAMNHGIEEIRDIFKFHDNHQYKNIQFLAHRSPMLEEQMLWSHHEKLCIIDQKVAFVGGIDLCIGRYETRDYRLFDPDREFHGKDFQNCYHKAYTNYDFGNIEVDEFPRDSYPRSPWQDIHSVVYGQAASDVGRHFIQRWNFCKQTMMHKDSKDRLSFLIPISTRPELTKVDNEKLLTPPMLEEGHECYKSAPFNLSCQVVRSLSLWSSGIVETEHSIYNSYVNMIKSAENFIYIENQFFITNASKPTEDSSAEFEVHNHIGYYLAEKVKERHRKKKDFKVYVVMPLVPGFDDEHGENYQKSVHHYQYLSIRKNGKKDREGVTSIFKVLKDADIDPEKYFSFCSLKNYQKHPKTGVYWSEGIYVHSKLMIVDDKTAIIGSANINDRSQLGSRDSEVCIMYR